MSKYYIPPFNSGLPAKCFTEFEAIDTKSKYGPITIEDANLFLGTSTKTNNGPTNAKRERVVACILNQEVPAEYYTYASMLCISNTWIECNLWVLLRDALDEYIKLLCGYKGISKITSIKCIIKAGRGNHHDFKLSINDNVFEIEFKYNADTITKIPQFVSPAKPSRYFISRHSSFEALYYENYLPDLAEYYGLSIPDRETYLKEVHGSAPSCLTEYKEKYKIKNNGDGDGDGKRDFWEFANNLSRRCIKQYIDDSELDIDVLNAYLYQTQHRKIYLLFKDGTFHYDVMSSDELNIVSVHKTHNSCIAKTASGSQLAILLRWKNGNGIAYPALQISIDRQNST
jgi:hypothetical protein